MKGFSGGQISKICFAVVMVTVTSAQHCSKRFVRGKWITSGDCGIKNDVIKGIKKTERNSFVPPTTCQGFKFEQIPRDLRNGTGLEIDHKIPGIGSKKVYCDATTNGGGWVVFQRRMNGYVDFNRTWNDYANGFGTPSGELWLGLEAIHQLTKDGDQELRVDMIENITGDYYYAEYSSFRVGSGADNYKLNVSGYSGNATDSLTNPGTGGDQHKQLFTTKDRDNDQMSYNCAVFYSGGWWFNHCYDSHLNGKYCAGVVWADQVESIARYMRFTEMKIRKRFE